MTRHERTTSNVGDDGPTDETSISVPTAGSIAAATAGSGTAATATLVAAPTVERSAEVAA